MLGHAMLMAAGGGGDYSAMILAGAPAAYWPLTEKTGTTAYDLSGNNRNGTYVGVPTLGGGDSVGGNKVARLNSDTDYIDVSAIASQISAAASSFECWFNVSTYNNAAISTAYGITFIQNTGSGGDNASALNFGARNAESKIIFWPGSNKDKWGPSGLPSTGSKHHIAYTLGGGLLNCYVDGALLLSAASTSTPGAQSGAWLGRRCWVSGGLIGSIGQAAFYTRALSAAEISAHYNAGK